MRKAPGKVHLIGAGPGDPELMTLVARLKGGDPLLFERGGGELAVLRAGLAPRVRTDG